MQKVIEVLFICSIALGVHVSWATRLAITNLFLLCFLYVGLDMFFPTTLVNILEDATVSHTLDLVEAR